MLLKVDLNLDLYNFSKRQLMKFVSDLLGGGGNIDFFPTDYPIPEYFFMTNPKVIFIFYFGDDLSKFTFCLNSMLKDTKILF
jgi:hypothetical protein